MTVLVVVHVLIAAHIVHFLLYGETLTPLEPSEARETIASGLINAGALFFLLLILSTLLFGRFFCGWACHVVFYQDVMRAILQRVGIRPQPLQSRTLVLVPLFAFVWLYGIPAWRRWGGGAETTWQLHLETDAFWRSFPGPFIAVLTFVVCGGLIVYVLGSKGFCTYGCPYGAAFGLADRVAPGRIRVKESCEQTGDCTRSCSSNVDVAAEVLQYGKVVNPGCLKCMDCVSSCPNDALYFGFRAAASRPLTAPRLAKAHDLTLIEDAVLVVLFAGAFLASNQLYQRIPFLLAVGGSVIAATLVLRGVQLLYRDDVQLQNVLLKRAGRCTLHGRMFAVVTLALVAVGVHSAGVQYHWSRGKALFAEAWDAREAGTEIDTHLERSARESLEWCDRFGVVHTRGSGRLRGQLAMWNEHYVDAIDHFERDRQAGSRSLQTGILLGDALLKLGRIDDAIRAYERASGGTHAPMSTILRAARQLDGKGAYLAQHAVLQSAVARRSQHQDAVLELCKLLMRCPDPRLRDPQTARRLASIACEVDAPHPLLLGFLAHFEEQDGNLLEALRFAEQAMDRARALQTPRIEEDMRAMANRLQEAIGNAGG